MFRFLLINYNIIYYDFIFIILIIALMGFTYSSLVALNQIDIKKIIAYSSIAHMNFSLIALFSQSIYGLIGVFIMMLGHAITSGLLFLGIGVLYDRYKTRIIFYYNSLVIFMPLFSGIYFLAILSNFGFPGTFNFVGEFFILIGGLQLNSSVIFLSTFGMVLSLIYSLFLYNRIFFGPLSTFMFIRYYCDIIRLEFYVLIIFVFIILLFGFFPNLILDYSLLNLFRMITII